MFPRANPFRRRSGLGRQVEGDELSDGRKNAFFASGQLLVGDLFRSAISEPSLSPTRQGRLLLLKVVMAVIEKLCQDPVVLTRVPYRNRVSRPS